MFSLLEFSATADRESAAPMTEYWQSNTYNIHLAAEDTTDADVLFAKCPQLRNSSCLVVDLKPGEMIYLPASWLVEVPAIPSSLNGVHMLQQFVSPFPQMRPNTMQIFVF